MTNELTTQLRQKAHELLALADQIDKQAAFPRLLNAASARRLNIKAAANIAGMSERSLYRIAPQIGERDGRSWLIDPERLAALLARRGETSPAMAKLGEADRCSAASDESLSHGKDRA